MDTGGDVVISRRAGADGVIGEILRVWIDACVRPTAGVGVKSLKNAGKKMRQSSCSIVASVSLCVLAM